MHIITLNVTPNIMTIIYFTSILSKYIHTYRIHNIKIQHNQTRHTKTNIRQHDHTLSQNTISTYKQDNPNTQYTTGKAQINKQNSINNPENTSKTRINHNINIPTSEHIIETTTNQHITK